MHVGLLNIIYLKFRGDQKAIGSRCGKCWLFELTEIILEIKKKDVAVNHPSARGVQSNKYVVALS